MVVLPIVVVVGHSGKESPHSRSRGRLYKFSEVGEGKQGSVSPTVINK